MNATSETISSIQPLQTEMNQPPRRYLTIVGALFAAAFVPLVCLIEWAGWHSGATVPLSSIAREQQDSDKILWLGAFKDYAAYKLERIKLVQPEVLLVGSSRCAQARAQMFRPYKTYDGCLTAWPLEHVVDFIDRATRIAKPRVVIVALDWFLFGDTLAEAWRKERTMDFRQGLNSHRRKVHDLIDFAKQTHWNLHELLASMERDKFEPIDRNRLLGIEATRGQFGFRSDGSIFVAPVYRRIADEQLAKGVENVTGSFPGGQHLSEKQFRHIEQLSQLARNRGFTLVAIQFPIFKPAADFMDTSQSYWPYAGLWRELRSEATAERFERLGIRFFDMSRDPLNADPENFFDPAHPTERGVLRTIIKLLDRKDFRDVFPQIDKAALEGDLQKNLESGERFDLYH
ncbi:MAG TPA: hypothetical protein VKR55_13860 [Bradyrhizobium sp.]|uniref:hypothetical protein n=1 Tax=Bradyrhizobium sp. TaxID=376 RepID=UPI002C57E325|nr:hypothetical protein [Bradyrhizobium sp.]HLZ03219.1 hypothetical protein [Bradyrhizobium sp.]